MKTDLAKDFASQYSKTALLEIATAAEGHMERLQRTAPHQIGIAAQMRMMDDVDTFRMAAAFLRKLAEDAT